MMAIEVEGVSKQIGRRKVLDDVTFVVAPGERVGLVGPNGAGKSMLLRVICGLVRPSAGRVRVWGREIGRDVEFPPDTGALIETPGFLPQYSGFRNLWLLAMIRNAISPDEVRAAMQRVGLDPDDPRPVRAYSTGMRQRLGLAQAIMEKPRLLLLDEPTSNIDPEGMEEIHRLLLALNREGTTLVITSHRLAEVERLCERVYEMDRGRLRPRP